MGGVGLGGGGLGDARQLELVRIRTEVKASFVLDAPVVVHGLAGYRTILYYLDFQSPVRTPLTVQARIYWLWDEDADPITDGFMAVRRDAVQDLVIDEPLLPIVGANATQRVILPLANPGGALAVAVGLRDVSGVGGGYVTEWVTAES
jgi:hypothetical protein